MSLANVKLAEIAQAGYAVRVMPMEDYSAESVVKAVDLATGQVWRGAGPSLIDAVEDLQRQLSEHESGVASHSKKETLAQPAPHTGIEKDFASLAIVLALVGVIFFVDLFATGINLGILYLVPLCVAFRRRLDVDWFAPLAVLSMLLIFVTQILTETFAGPQGQEPAGILNRCFAVFAIAGSSLVMKLLRDAQIYSQSSRDEYGSRPGENSQASFGQYLATHTRWMGWVTAFFIVAVFVGDLLTPVSANLPIFYLLPMALVAARHRRSSLWAFVALLLLLTVWGYVESPRAGIVPAEVSLVLLNRLATCAILALVALMFFIGKADASTGRDSGLAAR